MKGNPNNYWNDTSFGHPFGLWSHCPRELDEDGKTVYSNGTMLPNVPVAWGARAILNSRYDNPIDLLPDRQTIYCESPELRKPLCYPDSPDEGEAVGSRLLERKELRRRDSSL